MAKALTLAFIGGGTMAEAMLSGILSKGLASPGAIAVGSMLAAQLSGATVYAEDIADEAGNETRFLVISDADEEPTGSDLTSIAFTAYHDRPGSLVEVLGYLSKRGLNMTRIESRPTRQQLGTYVFLIDFEGHRTDAEVADTLRDIDEATPWLRVFGSYPRRAAGDA